MALICLSSIRSIVPSSNFNGNNSSNFFLLFGFISKNPNVDGLKSQGWKNPLLDYDASSSICEEAQNLCSTG